MTDAETPRRSVKMTWFLLAATDLSWMALAVVLLFVVPHVERVFRDFMLKLPAGTLFVIDVSRWFVKFWYVAMSFGILGFFGVMMHSWNLRNRPRESVTEPLWFATVLGVPLLLLLWIAVCLIQPLFIEIGPLSGNGKK